MKKAFISIALAAALFCGANAQTTATVPSWYSYQGVSDVKNAEVEVVFYVVTGANLTPVYAEKHSNVKTNAAGAFSCQLGLGALESVNNYDTKESIADIDWEKGPYKVQTWINGTLVGTAELGAVPYATLAGKALGIAGVEGDLNEVIEGLQQADADLFTYVDEQLANLNPVWGLITDLDEKVTANSDGLDIAQQDIADLTEANMENRGAIAQLTARVDALAGAGEVDLTAVNEAIEDLSQRMENQELGFTQLNNVVTDLAAEVQLNIEGLNNAEQSIIELTEGVANNGLVIEQLKGEIALNAEGLEVAQQDIADLTEANMENRGAIAQLNNVVTDLAAEVQLNIEGLNNAEQSIIELTEAVANNGLVIEQLKGEIALNAEGLEVAQQDIADLTEANMENRGAIAQLNQYMEGAYEQIEQVATLATGASNIAIANEERIEALEGKYDNVWKEIVKLHNLIDVQGEAIADLKAMIYNAVK